MPLYTAPCIDCRHFDQRRFDREVCTAFPDGIPLPILHGVHDHRTPWDGDQGIRWASRLPSQGDEPR